jgi:Ssu72-like protein
VNEVIHNKHFWYQYIFVNSFVGVALQGISFKLFSDQFHLGDQMVDSYHLRHAMVCASNVNRSMAAHALLKFEGLDVSSLVNLG